jgi:hypothetical protein
MLKRWCNSTRDCAAIANKMRALMPAYLACFRCLTLLRLAYCLPFRAARGVGHRLRLHAQRWHVEKSRRKKLQNCTYLHTCSRCAQLHTIPHVRNAVSDRLGAPRGSTSLTESRTKDLAIGDTKQPYKMAAYLNTLIQSPRCVVRGRR